MRKIWTELYHFFNQTDLMDKHEGFGWLFRRVNSYYRLWNFLEFDFSINKTWLWSNYVLQSIFWRTYLDKNFTYSFFRSQNSSSLCGKIYLIFTLKIIKVNIIFVQAGPRPKLSWVWTRDMIHIIWKKFRHL
jgi:hypothetical protein